MRVNMCGSEAKDNMFELLEALKNNRTNRIGTKSQILSTPSWGSHE